MTTLFDQAIFQGRLAASAVDDENSLALLTQIAHQVTLLPKYVVDPYNETGFVPVPSLAASIAVMNTTTSLKKEMIGTNGSVTMVDVKEEKA